MKKAILILLIPVIFLFQETFSQNAPISTIGNIETFGTTAVVPITVTGFTGIGSCEYIINFNPAEVSITSVTLGPGVSSYYFLEDEIAAGVYKVVWLFFQPGVQGLDLADNSVFMNINVQKVSAGYSNITFNNSSPGNCLFTDWNFNILNDTPKSTYYIDGSITFSSGSTEWTGNIDDDWSDNLNWTSGVPDAFTLVTINDVSPNQFPLAAANSECLSLHISSGASLTIPEAKTLTVNGNFFNDGQFTVESTATGDGSFINYGVIMGTGTVTIERYLESEMWHYISPPITGGLSGIFTDIYLMEWDEPSGLWSFITPTNIELNPMQGYGVWADDDITGSITVSYECSSPNLNTGSFISGYLTAVGPNNPIDGNRGFNFVGNPFPSAIDWDQGLGWDKSTLANAIYIWNDPIGNYGSYVNGISINDVTNIIPGGQGFYVHNSYDLSTVTLKVNNNARVHDPKPFLKTTDTENKSIYLSISSEINTYSDEIIIMFSENSTANFDPSFDALNMIGNDEAPDLLTKSVDDKNLSINSYSELIENVVIPLNCKIGINGYYTINAKEILNFYNSTEILLEDKTENIFIDLTTQNSYSFFANTSDNVDRFNLHFLLNPVSTFNIENNLNIQIFAANNAIHMNRHDSKVLEGSLQVYDLFGRNVASTAIKGVKQYEFPLDETGIFIIAYFDAANQKEYRQKVHLK